MTPGRRVGRKDEVFGKGRGNKSNAKTGARMVIGTGKEGRRVQMVKLFLEGPKTN